MRDVTTDTARTLSEAQLLSGLGEIGRFCNATATLCLSVGVTACLRPAMGQVLPDEVTAGGTT